MSELKKKGLVGSSSDLANILNKVSSTTAGAMVAPLPSAALISATTAHSYTHLAAQSSIPSMSLPPPGFTHGYLFCLVLSHSFLFIFKPTDELKMKKWNSLDPWS